MAVHRGKMNAHTGEEGLLTIVSHRPEEGWRSTATMSKLVWFRLGADYWDIRYAAQAI